jgi:DNA-binding CsgD family transcriptional regulator
VEGLGVVGREAELSEVDAFLAAASGEFVVLALEGAAGIGKTTVWEQGRRRAEDRGARVLWSRPSVAEAKLSFTGVADLLARIEEETLGALPEPQREALEVAMLRAKPARRAGVARAVAAGFLGVVRALAATAPVVLAVDDAQWLDPPSRGVLEFAARRLEREPVGLLLSVRTPGPASPVAGAVAEERLRRVVLGPLSLAALGRIVAARLGSSLPRPVLVRIVQASGGNPFYALEIARLVIEREAGYGAGSALPVPEDLQALTAVRIRRLPAAAREALLLASILSAPDSEMIDPDALLAAEEAEIVSVDGRGRIEFVHPLFASAVSASVPSALRREAHRRAAEIVSDPEQRARHLALGSAGPDGAVALRLVEAATLAAARGAVDAAAELAELSAQLTPAACAGERGARLLSAARFHFEAGDLARAEALVKEAAMPGSADDVRAQALQLAAHLSGRRSGFGEAIELAGAALALAGVDDRLRGEVELELAYSHASLGDFPRGARYAQAAISHSEAGEDGLHAEALAVTTILEFMAGRGLVEERLARALALEDPARTARFVFRPRYIQGNLQLWLGDVEAALATYAELHAELVDQGQEGAVPMLFLYLVWSYLWHGELDRAAAIAARAREAATLLDDMTAAAVGLGAGALVHAYGGRGDAARAEAMEALGLFEQLQWRPGSIWPLWALGLVELSEGNAAGVDAVLRPLADQFVATDGDDPVLLVDPVLCVFLPDEIEALIALGEFERAQTYLLPFERRAGELDRAWAIAAAARCRGALIAAERGDPELVFAAFDRALAAHARTAMPLERARTLLLAGQARRRYKQRGLARAALTEALEVFEAAGATRWAERAFSERARIGRPAPGSDELTGTERRVADLAAEGLSNQEIAERAFLSIKTVEANLTRVYRKLGVRSRAGLVRALSGGDGAGSG